MWVPTHEEILRTFQIQLFIVLCMYPQDGRNNLRIYNIVIIDSFYRNA